MDKKPFDAAEIRLKTEEKRIFRNTEKLTLAIGDMLPTEAISRTRYWNCDFDRRIGKIQMKRKAKIPMELAKIYRKASQRDIDIWTEAPK